MHLIHSCSGATEWAFAWKLWAVWQHSTLGVIDVRIRLIKEVCRKILTEATLHGFDVTLFEAVCLASDSTNELLEIGGYSPYQRAYGRNPRRMLDPQNLTSQALSDPDDTLQTGMERKLMNMSLARKAFFEAVTDSRFRTALNSKTRRGTCADLQNGDECEFCRERKGLSFEREPWVGPAVVVDIGLRESLGTVTIRWQGKDLKLPARRVRPRSPFLWFAESYHLAIVQEIKNLCLGIRPGSSRLYGYSLVGDHLCLTKHTEERPEQWNLCEETAAQLWGVENALGAVRAFRGVRRLAHPAGAVFGTLLIWKRSTPYKHRMVDIAVHGTADLMQLAGGDFAEHDGLIFYGYNRIDFDEFNSPDTTELPAAAFHPPPRPGNSTATRPELALPPPFEIASAPEPAVLKRHSRHVTRMDTPPCLERCRATGRERREAFERRASPLAIPIDEEDWQRLQAAIDLPTGETDSEYESAVSADFDDADDQLADFYFDLERRQILLVVGDDVDINKLDREQALFESKCKGSDTELFLLEIRHAKIWKAAGDFEELTAAELEENKPEVRAAKLKELKPFLSEHSFNAIHRSALKGRKAMGGRWVIRWKRKVDPKTGKVTRVIKCRLCVKGFSDPQKDIVATFNPVAGELSQKMLLHVSVSYGYKLRSWDISNAFLRGLKFADLHKLCKSAGIPCVDRECFMMPPPDVWELLSELGMKHAVNKDNFRDWLWELLVAVYGLVDGPRLFSMALAILFKEGTVSGFKCQQSLMDPCCFSWFKLPSLTFAGLASTHLDDEALAVSDELYPALTKLIEERFGTLTKQETCFVHCGLQYKEFGPRHIHADQQEYVMGMVTTELPRSIRNDQILLNEYLTDFRSDLGGANFALKTRFDQGGNVHFLQSQLGEPKGEHSRMIKKVIADMKETASLGLHFKALNEHKSLKGQRMLALSDGSYGTLPKGASSIAQTMGLANDGPKLGGNINLCMGKG